MLEGRPWLLAARRQCVALEARRSAVRDLRPGKADRGRPRKRATTKRAMAANTVATLLWLKTNIFMFIYNPPIPIPAPWLYNPIYRYLYMPKPYFIHPPPPADPASDINPHARPPLLLRPAS